MILIEATKVSQIEIKNFQNLGFLNNVHTV